VGNVVCNSSITCCVFFYAVRDISIHENESKLPSIVYRVWISWEGHEIAH
jgi:hypothetical protein